MRCPYRGARRCKAKPPNPTCEAETFVNAMPTATSRTRRGKRSPFVGRNGGEGGDGCGRRGKGKKDPLVVGWGRDGGCGCHPPPTQAKQYERMDGWMDARIGGLIYSTGCEVVEERTGVEDAPALVDPKPTRT